MPRLTPVPLEDLEMKALWIFAELNSGHEPPTLAASPELLAARDRGIAKLYASASGHPVLVTEQADTRLIYPVAFGAGRALLAGLQTVGALLTRLMHRPARARPAAVAH